MNGNDYDRIRFEFGADFARELSEDMPELDARMIAQPWHNDTAPKWIAELPNGAAVYLWADRRDAEQRELIDSARFTVCVYASLDVALTGVTVTPETETDDAAAVAGLVAAGLALAESL